MQKNTTLGIVLASCIEVGCGASCPNTNGEERLYPHQGSLENEEIEEDDGAADTTRKLDEAQLVVRAECRHPLRGQATSYGSWRASGLVTAVGNCGDWEVLQVNFTDYYYYAQRDGVRTLVGTSWYLDFGVCNTQYSGEIPTHCKHELVKVAAPKADPLLQD